MNQKLKLLVLAVIAMAAFSFVADSKSSLQSILSLATFVMMFHMHLSRHCDDVAEIHKAIIVPPPKKDETQTNDQQPIIKTVQSKIPTTQYSQTSETISQALRDGMLQNLTPKLEYDQVEDQRIDHQTYRNLPGKAIFNQMKALRNMKQQKLLVNDELEAEEKRIWWEDISPTA